MKKRTKKLIISLSLFFAFIIFTLLVATVGVKEIGPLNSAVGFADLNQWVHSLTGVNMTLYMLTDWLGLVPVAVALRFALIGFCQWIKRKKIFKVDRDIFALGVFYLAVIAAYVLFEFIALNYRPVLIDGELEASYPSSTTLLAVCVVATAIMQIKIRIKNRLLRYILSVICIVFIAFTVIARLLSGVHWITDIIGSLILSFGFIMLYSTACEEK